MRKLLVASVVTALALVAAAPASADPTSNGENCVGFFMTLGSGPGFGDSVSDMAQGDGFDDTVHFLRDACSG